jgi:hypothetical protein
LRDYDAEKKQYEEHKYSVTTLDEAKNEKLVTALYDAISNLTLLTETLGSTSQKVIVAFGAKHMVLLKGVLEDLNAQRG